MSDYDRLAEYGLVGEHGEAVAAFGELLRLLQEDKRRAIVALKAVKQAERERDPMEEELSGTAPPA